MRRIRRDEQVEIKKKRKIRILKENTNSLNIRIEEYEENNKKKISKNSKKDETKKVRTYGRTVYINFDPKWIKKGWAPSKNPSE